MCPGLVQETLFIYVQLNLYKLCGSYWSLIHIRMCVLLVLLKIHTWIGLVDLSYGMPINIHICVRFRLSYSHTYILLMTLLLHMFIPASLDALFYQVCSCLSLLITPANHSVYTYLIDELSHLIYYYYSITYDIRYYWGFQWTIANILVLLIIPILFLSDLLTTSCHYLSLWIINVPYMIICSFLLAAATRCLFLLWYFNHLDLPACVIY